MPLLLCPNDSGSMQTVQRSGVEFDICPTCRGVWLDRGELEKLLELAREPGPNDIPTQNQQPRADYDNRPPQRYAGRRERDDDDDDDRYRGRKRRSSIFDIFD